jgi:hypothetical protein
MYFFSLSAEDDGERHRVSNGDIRKKEQSSRKVDRRAGTNSRRLLIRLLCGTPALYPPCRFIRQPDAAEQKREALKILSARLSGWKRVGSGGMKSSRRNVPHLRSIGPNATHIQTPRHSLTIRGPRFAQISVGWVERQRNSSPI